MTRIDIGQIGSGATTINGGSWQPPAGGFALAGADDPNTDQTQPTVLDSPAAPSGNPTIAGATSTITLVGGANTITAGAGTTVVYASGGSAQVFGGDGTLVFVAGSGNYFVTGGSGSNLLYGGAGSDDLGGGLGAGNVLVAGSGNTTLSGGGGSAAILFGGAGRDLFEGGKGGSDTMVGGTGGNTFFLTNGDVAYGGPGSADTFNIAGTAALVVEGAGTAQVNLNGGTVTAFDGTGPDTYVLAKGYGVQAAVVGFKAGDRISLADGFTAADARTALANATAGSFGSLLTFGTGTSIVLFGVAPASVQITIV